MPRLPLLLALAALAAAGCDSLGLDRVDERVTDAVLTLTPQGGGDAVTITATDPDGDGRGFFFTPAFVRLRAGATYAGTLALRDADADLTAEIQDEAEIHLVRVRPDQGSSTPTDRESDYTALDTNGADLPVGLRFRLSVDAEASGAGTVGVTLFHYDAGAKTGPGVLSDARDLDVDVPVVYARPAAAAPGA